MGTFFFRKIFNEPPQQLFLSVTDPGGLWGLNEEKYILKID
jgi:hypothetical protein